ncbi:MAG: cobyric acid synthase [Elusimicrobia bacterium]|nr:cobyric acid synthase [Elusimicrobiota bacterium]
MRGKVIMVQGTGSYVGKSVIATALCRIFKQDGLRVAPFKAQNMANNSYVTKDGGEIGRAQAVQAEACGLEPSVLMNPVLLKPTTDVGSQIIVMGKPRAMMQAVEYHAYKRKLLPQVAKALETLRAGHDVVVIEGAGSPAEINLKKADIVNMRIARLAQAPVILVGDIDKGGVFAQLIGTLELLTEAEKKLICGFVINKFRGDKKILDPGLRFVEKKSGKKVLGVIPYLKDCEVAEEDTIPLEKLSGHADGRGKVLVEVVRLPRISNSTDFEPLERERDVSLRYIAVPPMNSLPDVLIIPGSKSTIADLRFLRESGLAGYVQKCARAGVEIVGICGGYQMLGKRIFDPKRVEAAHNEAEGLGLLESITVFSPKKMAAQVRAVHVGTGLEIEGYEIHMGCTQGNNDHSAVFKIVERHGIPVEALDGASTASGNVWGTYIHGIFDSSEFRRAFLNRLRKSKGLDHLQPAVPQDRLAGYDRLAAVVRKSLDMKKIYSALDASV